MGLTWKAFPYRKVISIRFGPEMYRKAGAIPPIQQDKIPNRMVVFDTEAYRAGFVAGVELQTLRLGVAHFMEIDPDVNIVKEDWLEFRDVGDLISWLEFLTRKDKSLYVYAHNLKYDLQLSGLLTGLISEGWKVGLFVISDPPTFLRLKRGRMSIIFVDTFNYWQTSLASMGKQIGLDKLEMPDDEKTDRDWFVYCRRDVEVLGRYLIEFISYLVGHDLAPLGFTVASQAFRAYRHRFMPREITLHNDPKATSLERDGYSGARVEAFFIGQAARQDYYKLDVNSMYPYVMKGNPYPLDLVSFSKDVPLFKLEGLIERYYCIADVTLQTRETAYACKMQHKLIFPAGRIQTVLHSPEIRLALSQGAINQIHRLAIYREGDLFTPYVDYFYRLKLDAEDQANPLLRSQAKLFLNSLYGKFGQRDVISKLVDNPGDPSYQRLTGYSESLGCQVEINYLGDVIQVTYHGGESVYSFPAIAGSVTAQARLYLYELMGRAGFENVFYVDTDSLIVNTEGYFKLQALLDDHKLGYLKLEGVSDQLIIRGAKDYMFGDEVKHKGLPKSAIQLDQNLWQYEQFRGAKTWLSEGLPSGVTVTQRLKARRSDYDKGKIAPDGKVTPLLF